MNTNQKLPSDSLKRTHPGKIAAIVSAAALAIALGVTGGSAWAARSANTAAAPRAIAVAQIPVNVPMTLSPSSVEGSEAVDAAQVAAAVQAAAEAAAAVATQHQSSGFGGNAPAGTPIPLVLDNDPNSGSYGQMVIVNPDTFCASNGGTTRSDGVAVCS